MELTLDTAKVLDISDPDLKGKIQIQLPSMMNITDTTLCPWAIPFVSHNSSGECETFMMEQDLPSVGETIWVLHDQYYKRFYYLSRRYFENVFNSENITNIFGTIGTNIDDLESDENASGDINPLADNLEINDDNPFTNLKFTMYHNGSLMFHNQIDGTTGFIQYTINDTPTFTIIDKDGNMITNVSLNKIEYVATDDIKKIGANKVLHVEGETHNEFTGVVDEIYHDKVTQEYEKSKSIKYDDNYEVTSDKEIKFEAQKAIGVKSTSDAISIEAMKDVKLASTGAGKINIGNSISNLKTSLDDLYDFCGQLCDTLRDFQSVGSPAAHTSSPAVIAQMITLKAQITAKKNMSDQVFN